MIAAAMPTWAALTLEFVEDSVKLVIAVASVYLATKAYVRRMQPGWLAALQNRRTALLWIIVLAAVAIKLSEDVLGGEAGPIDRWLLLFIRAHVPLELDGFFGAVTLTGASKMLFPLTAVAAIGLVLARRYRDAALLAGSVVMATALVYVIKTVVGRERPALWEAQWYWGSSFPSGHTLVVASFATAGVIVASRIWPSAKGSSWAVALTWVALVGLSRLLLGVHWPTDVLAAACIGACIPLAVALALELRAPRPAGFGSAT